MEKGKEGRFTMKEIIIKFTRKKAMFTAQETLFFYVRERGTKRLGIKYFTTLRFME